MKPITKLHHLGQSVWYDNIERRLLKDGTLARMINEGVIKGVTSNPSIFNNAISNSTDYDDALVPLAKAGKTTQEIYEALAVSDIQAACDLFLPLYDETQGGDGYVSLEVSPYLADGTNETLADARRLWALVDRPNLMVKIPATQAGLPAITQAIAEGINVNVTLIFSIDRYRDVMEAYLVGLEARLYAGEPIDQIASVASFFVSRIDSNVDQRLDDLVNHGKVLLAHARETKGKVAIANAKLAFALHKEIFNTERFAKLKAKGGRIQRPLWASTSTKDPAYPDTKYVDELIAPGTVNTIPPKTLEAFSDHGNPTLTLEADLDDARKVLEELPFVGISLAEVTQELEIQGVKSFSDAFTTLLDSVETRRLASLKD
jgi:transaldolase